MVAMIGTPGAEAFHPFPLFWLRTRRHFMGLLTGSLEDRRRYVKGRLERRQRTARAAASPEEQAVRATLAETNIVAIRSYNPGYYAGQVDLFITSYEPRQADPWRKLARSVCVHDLRAYERDELLLGARVSELAAPFSKTLKSRSQKLEANSAAGRAQDVPLDSWKQAGGWDAFFKSGGSCKAVAGFNSA